MKIKRKILFLLLLFISVLLFSEEKIQAEATINWSNTTINIIMTANLPDEVNVLPEAKIQAESKIQDSVSIIIQMTMEHVLLNSQFNVFERLKKNLALTSLIENYSNEKYKIRSHLTPTLQQLKAYYQIPLYPDFCETFVEHETTIPIPKFLHYVPSQNYSGIIIYAEGDLPLFGEKAMAKLNPCLFPKIYNDKGELIFLAENIPPQLLIQKGAVQYIDHLDKAPIQRIGVNPLKIQATAIFGKNKTDIVIPSYFSDQILVRKQNRKLLEQGKIIIVCSKEKIKSSLHFTE